MAKGYRPVDREQRFLLPPDMREWLPAGHPVWLVIEVVGRHLDTSAFHAGRRTGGAGAAGYDPDMLVTVLVWAYANGVTSSRRVEGLCATDVAFRVICGGNLPDHATIARFRAGFAQAVPVFFAEVLGLCARLGMARLGTVALDGTKVAASASMSANRTEAKLAQLARDIAARHAETDAAEDGLFGVARGDEVPEDAWRPGSRDGRIRAALAGLHAERDKADEAEQAKARAFRERRRAGQQGGHPPASAAVALAEEDLDRARAARTAQLAALRQRRAAGEPRRGRQAGVDDYCRVVAAAARLDKARARAAQAARVAAEREASRKGPGPVRNTTDPDSRLMRMRGGAYVQGYNAQNLTSEDGLVIATQLTSDPVDYQWFQPMAQAGEAAAALIAAARRPTGPGDRIGLILADAGYCSEANLTTPGPDRLIAVGTQRGLETAARDGSSPGRQRTGPATLAMAARLKTKDGLTAYRQRGHIAETPHANIKHNMGFRQLSMRGKTKTTAEWAFTATIHNLFKAITSGHLTTQALATLPA